MEGGSFRVGFVRGGYEAWVGRGGFARLDG